MLNCPGVGSPRVGFGYFSLGLFLEVKKLHITFILNTEVFSGKSWY